MPVPSGATSGNVVVTVGGVASNGVTFTVTTPAPNITRFESDIRTRRNFGHDHGDKLWSTQATSTMKFNGTAGTPTSWSATAYVRCQAHTGNLLR